MSDTPSRNKQPKEILTNIDIIIARLDKKESFENIEIRNVSFENYLFKFEVNFSGAIFCERISFKGARFHDKTCNFVGTQFIQGADFSNALFRGKILNRNEEIFESEVNFNAAYFGNGADFNNVNFNGDVSFENVHFKYGAYFQESQFKGSTYFSNACFDNDVYFDRSRFQGEEALFEETIFKEKVFFRLVRFKSDAYFNKTQFKNEIHFNETFFENKAIFEGVESKKIFAFTENNFFVDVTLKNPSEVTFRNANLKKCSFLKTNISNINFIDITWANSKEIEWGNYLKKLVCYKRDILYDEILVRKNNRDYKQVEELCRQIKANFEAKKNFDRAGDFYFGEMEMKRKTLRIRKAKALFMLYKISSGYGETVGRSVLLLGFLTLFFSSAYLFNGIKSINPDMQQIKYNLTWGIPPLKDLFNDLLKAFVHFVQVATFQKVRGYKVINDLGRIFEAFQVILISVQTTLVVLAIKRKFKR